MSGSSLQSGIAVFDLFNQRNASMQHFSIWSLLRNSMSYHEGWQKQWRSPEPKAVPASTFSPMRPTGTPSCQWDP